MKKIMIFFMSLTIGLLVFGLGQKNVRAATESADMTINNGSQIPLSPGQTYGNVNMETGGILKTEAGTEEDKITVIVDGNFTISNSKAEDTEDSFAVINLSDNSEMIIKGKFVVEEYTHVEIRGDIKVCGNVQIGKGGKLDIVSGDFKVMPDKQDNSEEEIKKKWWPSWEQQESDDTPVFENLGTVRINRKKAALLVDNSYEIKTSTSNETQDDGTDPVGTTDNQNKTEGIFLFSSHKKNEDSEQLEWSDALECPYGTKPGDEQFKEVIKKEEIHRPELYDFDNVKTEDSGIWDVPTEEKYHGCQFTYKQPEGEVTSDDGTTSKYAEVWFTMKVLVVPADIPGSEEIEKTKITIDNITDEQGNDLSWSDILNEIRGLAIKENPGLDLTQVKLPGEDSFQSIPEDFKFDLNEEEKEKEYNFEFQINYTEAPGKKPGNYNPITVTVTINISKKKDDIEQEDPGKPIPSTPSAPVTDLSKPTPGDPTVETPKPSVPAPSTPVQETPSTASEGKCGDNVTYRYKDGVLTISGKGAMTDLSCQNTKTLEEDASAGRKSNYGGMDAYAEKTKKIVIESGVTRIGRGAFAYFKNLESVEIKGGKKAKLSVGQYAFAGCGKLKKVSMKNVKEINFFAFGNCKSLKKLTLRKGVTSIGKSAFYGCKKLKSINLPSTVKEMGDYCFYGCKKLKTVKVNGNIKKAGKYMFYSAGKKAVIRCASKKANNCKFVKKANAEGIKIKRK